MLLKSKPPNASERSPKADALLGCVPPSELCLSCCIWVAGCGFGAVAYKDNIDCLRSGLEIPVDLLVDDALDGLSGGAPKKSSPPNSCDGCCCLGGGG